MRVDQQDITSLGGSGSFGSVSPLGKDSGAHPASWEGNQTDIVNLSGASNLIAVAKNSVPSDRASKIASLTTQVRSGNYQANSNDISRSMIQDLSES